VALRTIRRQGRRNGTDRAGISASERQQILESADFRCHVCGLPIFPGQEWEVSYLRALEVGGKDTHANRRPAHEKCYRDRLASLRRGNTRQQP